MRATAQMHSRPMQVAISYSHCQMMSLQHLSYNVMRMSGMSPPLPHSLGEIADRILRFSGALHAPFHIVVENRHCAMECYGSTGHLLSQAGWVERAPIVSIDNHIMHLPPSYTWALRIQMWSKIIHALHGSGSSGDAPKGKGTGKGGSWFQGGYSNYGFNNTAAYSKLQQLREERRQLHQQTVLEQQAQSIVGKMKHMLMGKSDTK
eukprot:TRINITY_DN79350_c0_g1_i1.p1 TRINITY_DN79350_c0_g1~~TRINITY_DN79350_c0_g1_i1.p1  ORF type:complete len:206 (+),score=19.18 TRINITY_DN79350_c0_g1_i1:505-1122(+)